MNITIIGAGNMGSSLAIAFRKAGHSVIFGVKDPLIAFKGKEQANQYGIPFFKVPEAVYKSEVIVLSTPAQLAHEVAKGLGDVSNKLLIDTMNAVFMKPAHYDNTAEAILDNCNASDLVKCFNTTGYENIINPVYNGTGIDMFVAGDSEKAKKTAIQLSLDIGFEHCYDFGGDAHFSALEQFAFAWINLAVLQKNSRDIALKLIRRD